ncbi:MAG: protoporphyrinogen oxidase [Armatimonadetes bacterium]|nr:protoporphyrinogen oxidase [Armatimonadota bacterium]
MPKSDVVYATTHGQTRKIAERIAEVLRSEGHDVTVSEFGGEVREDSTTVVLGGPVYIGSASPELCQWAKERQEALASRTVAFFTVSMSASDKRDVARLEDARIVEEALSASRLEPDFIASLAGSLDYTKYPYLKRMLMKRIARLSGGPQDTGRDHELTDWEQVDAFARAVAAGDRSSAFSTNDRTTSGATV